jgi:lincosamide nucleotidyltransferase A/C/D/E
MQERSMPGDTVARVCRALSESGVTVWLDGGWGVDALLMEATRAHGDLDLVVEEGRLSQALALLSGLGFTRRQCAEDRPWNFVLVDPDGREVDLHVISFDPDGRGIYGPPENGESYSVDAFAGRGVVNGEAVLCMSAAFQIANRQGYDLRDKDRHDIEALRDRFFFAPPSELN